MAERGMTAPRWRTTAPARRWPDRAASAGSGAGKARGEIGGGEAVAGGRGVDDVAHGLGDNGLVGAAQEDANRRLRQLEHHLDTRIAGGQLVHAVRAEQQLEVLGRGQHDVGARERRAEGGLGDLAVRPAAGAEIGVEGDAAAAGADHVEGVEQPGAPGLAVERQGDPRQVDEVVAGQSGRDLGRLRQVEQQPRRRAVAPVVEAALAVGVGAR